jgi:hypothetical protein
MPLTPLRIYRRPGYPTQDYLLEHPELLRLVPKRWQNHPIVIALLGIMVLLSASCQHAGSNGNPSKSHASHVAPIFRAEDERMKGECTYCLSEGEAINEIMKIAKKYGLNFSHDTTSIAQFEYEEGSPQDSTPYCQMPETGSIAMGHNSDGKLDSKSDTLCRDSIAKHLRTHRIHYFEIHLDGRDANRNVGFVYVGHSGRSKVNRNRIPAEMRHTPINSSDWRFSLQQEAKEIQGLLASYLDSSRSEQPVVGIFYQPLTNVVYHPPQPQMPNLSRAVTRYHLWELFNDPLSINDPKPGRWQRTLSCAFCPDYYDMRESSKAKLRRQVRDFIQWLKAQGII